MLEVLTDYITVSKDPSLTVVLERLPFALPELTGLSFQRLTIMGGNGQGGEGREYRVILHGPKGKRDICRRVLENMGFSPPASSQVGLNLTGLSSGEINDLIRLAREDQENSYLF